MVEVSTGSCNRGRGADQQGVGQLAMEVYFPRREDNRNGEEVLGRFACFRPPCHQRSYPVQQYLETESARVGISRSSCSVLRARSRTNTIYLLNLHTCSNQHNRLFWTHHRSRGSRIRNRWERDITVESAQEGKTTASSYGGWLEAFVNSGKTLRYRERVSRLWFIYRFSGLMRNLFTFVFPLWNLRLFH